jgi:hypothetical protein
MIQDTQKLSQAAFGVAFAPESVFTKVLSEEETGGRHRRRRHRPYKLEGEKEVKIMTTAKMNEPRR